MIGDVHQHLRALARLTVFVGHVVVVRVLADIGKMLRHRGGDVHLPQRRAIGLGQQHGVVLGAAGGAKARHRHRDDAAAVQPHPIECVHHHDQRQRRIQPAGQPHHRPGAVRMAQASAQALCLHRQNLLAALSQTALVLRNKGRRLYGPAQRKVAQRQHKVRHRQCLRLLGIRVHTAALAHQTRHVHIRQRKTRLIPRGLGQQRTVFRDEVVPGEHHILAGFALSCVGIEIGAYQSARLSRHQLAAVSGLAHDFVAGRQVDDYRRAGGGQTLRGRRRHPQVLANLRAQHEIGQTVARKQLRGAQQRALSAQRHLVAHLRRRDKVSCLVELRIIGHAALGHQAEQAPCAQDRRAVVQRRAMPYGKTYCQHTAQLPRSLQYRAQCTLCALQQRLGQKQVAACVPREAQLRENDQPCVLLRGLMGEFYGALRIKRTVRHLQLRRGGAYAQKSVLHTVQTPSLAMCFSLLVVYPKRANLARIMKRSSILRTFLQKSFRNGCQRAKDALLL